MVLKGRTVAEFTDTTHIKSQNLTSGRNLHSRFAVRDNEVASSRFPGSNMLIPVGLFAVGQ